MALGATPDADEFWRSDHIPRSLTPPVLLRFEPILFRLPLPICPPNVLIPLGLSQNSVTTAISPSGRSGPSLSQVKKGHWETKRVSRSSNQKKIRET